MQIVASPVFGVRVSDGHLCKAEAPTEVETETVSCTKNSLPCVRGAGVRRTPMQSRSTDRGGNRDGGSRMADGGVVTYFRLIRKPM